MPSAQAEHLVGIARDFHTRLSAYYHRLAGQTANTRLQLVLSHLSEQEARLSTTLSECVRDTHQAVLTQWLKFPPTLRLPDLQKNPLSDPGCIPDDVVLLSQRMDRVLATMFAEAARGEVSSEVRELFESLVALEQATEQQTASCTTCAT